MKKRKSKKSEAFLDDLCIAITESYLFRTRTSRISERQMQAEIRPLIAKYLEEHFKDAGYVKIDKMVHDNFYWEGQDSSFQSDRSIFLVEDAMLITSFSDPTRLPLNTRSLAALRRLIL